jgi:hypothetical protein
MRLPATVRDKCEISLGPRQVMRIPRTVQVREGFTHPKVDPPTPPLSRRVGGLGGSLTLEPLYIESGRCESPPSRPTGAPIGGSLMSNPEPLAVRLRAVGRYLIAVCPRNQLTLDPAQPAVRMAPADPLRGILRAGRRAGARGGGGRLDSFLSDRSLRTTGPSRPLHSQPLSIPQPPSGSETHPCLIRASRRKHP